MIMKTTTVNLKNLKYRQPLDPRPKPNLVISLIIAALLPSTAPTWALTGCGSALNPCPDQADPITGATCGPGVPRSGPPPPPPFSGGCQSCMGREATFGSPVYWVSLPYCNVRIEDVPLWWHPA